MKSSMLLALPLIATSAPTMPTKEITPGVKIPLVSIGTWTSGSLFKDHAYDIVTAWLKQGYRGIDTALNYFDQTRVAKAIADQGVAREDLFITTKIPGCLGGMAKAALDWDLSRLNTTYVDLMLIHLDIGLPGSCPETWKVMEEFVKEGKIKAIGVSNFGKAHLQKLNKIATVPIAVNQIEYNVFHHDDATMQYMKANNITVEAWSPLGGAGLVPGPSIFKDATVGRIAKNHNVSAAQVALRWIIQRGDILAVMSANPAHQANDADLFSFKLEDSEMDELTKLKSSQSVLV